MKNKSNIKAELEDLAPILSKVKKTDRKSPDLSYFESMQSKVFHQISSQLTEEEQLNDYFDNLPHEVVQKTKPSKSLRIITLQKWAAVIVLVVMAGFLFYNQFNELPTDNSDFVSELNEEEMLYLLSEYSSTEEIALLTDDFQDEIQVPDDTDVEDLLYLIDEIDLIEELEL